MGWNYLSFPKLQRCNRWSLGMDKWFHPTLYQACDYLSMLGLKLNHVSKRGHREQVRLAQRRYCRPGVGAMLAQPSLLYVYAVRIESPDLLSGTDRVCSWWTSVFSRQNLAVSSWHLARSHAQQTEAQGQPWNGCAKDTIFHSDGGNRRRSLLHYPKGLEMYLELLKCA